MRVKQASMLTDLGTQFFELDGPIVKVAASAFDRLDFWFLAGAEAESSKREFRAIRTGEWFDPEEWGYVATTERHPATGLVWHLLERNQ